MKLDIPETLRQLVAIPSVNPMGRSVAGPEYFECRLTDYLQALFARLGLPWQRQTIAPQRDNIVARLAGESAAGKTLVMFEVHQDTVPVDGMTIPPWEAGVRNGRLYGRGACDVKGGMAAMLTAIARLADARPRNRPDVVLACTVNEEHGFTGATGLCRLWSNDSPSLFPKPPDAAIVAEPTQLDVVVAHKGVVRWRCHANGRAAHSSRPEAGDNAIYRMARVVSALAHYDRDLLAGRKTHPLCGRPTLSVGTIAGGLSVNTVPDRATIEIDRRLLPGEDPAEAHRQVIDYLARAIADGDELAHIHHDPPFMQNPGLSEAANAGLAERMAAAVRSVGRRGNIIGVSFGTDATAISAAGIPTVVFGPGSIEQAHTADEWISLAEVEEAAEILFRFASEA